MGIYVFKMQIPPLEMQLHLQLVKKSVFEIEISIIKIDTAYRSEGLFGVH